MRRLLPLIALSLLPACSPLRTFNALVPKDAGVERIALGEAFREGRRGSLDLYAPRRRGQEALPVVVFFYGGSWRSGSKESYAFAARAIASQGFLVAVPDYRLVPDSPYPAFLEDGAEAVRWVEANAGRFGGDPARMVVAGHSAGAYIASMLALDPRWLGDGRKSLRGFAALSGPFSFLPLDTEVTRETFGQVADLPSTQPINFVTGDDPPALLMSGGKDRIVFASNSIGMATRLSEAGVPVDVRIYDNLGHSGVVSALSTLLRGRAPVLRDFTAFARRVTGTQAQQGGS